MHKRERRILLITSLLVFCIDGHTGTEAVFVSKVMSDGDQVIIIRRNGQGYLIEKGVGCLSLWRYEGKSVLVSSPGLFLGVGSRLIIPEANQECRIWNSTPLEGSAGSAGSTRARSGFLVPSRDSGQIALFDSEGSPVAYVSSDDDFTIYLWAGKPVAYLKQARNGITVYGFNGTFLGWFDNGIVLDREGYAVAFIEGAAALPTKPEPIKGLKELKPLRAIEQLEPLKPLTKGRWSSLPVEGFLLMGVDSASDNLLAKPPRGATGRSSLQGEYLGIGASHWIQTVSGNGEIITLEDGSIWEISSLDQIDTALWSPVSDIAVLRSNQPVGEFRYVLVNTDDGEKALAKYVGGR